MTKSARTVGNEREYMHAGRRFGDVVVGGALDHELAWFFNTAESAMELPSVQGQLLAGRQPGSVGALLSRVEATHAARKICERLKSLDVRDALVLAALYTERRWPRALVHKLQHLAGVVESLPGVRAQHLGERETGRTRATSTTAWLDELVADRPEQAVMWREEAGRACARAVSAYQQVRGDDESVVPEEDDR